MPLEKLSADAGEELLCRRDVLRALVEVHDAARPPHQFGHDRALTDPRDTFDREVPTVVSRPELLERVEDVPSTYEPGRLVVDQRPVAARHGWCETDGGGHLVDLRGWVEPEAHLLE